jgi:hypothetical protein
MNFFKTLLILSFLTEHLYAQEAIFAASDSVLLIAEELHSQKISSEQAVSQVKDLGKRHNFSTTDLSVIQKYIDPHYLEELDRSALGNRQADQQATARLDDFKSLSSSRLELSKTQKTVLMLSLGIAAGLLILDSQGKKIEVTW